jgi:inosine-uridine nucleoside N-ribohydrolase
MKIPVILDTDLGTDIDDTWALGFLLKCPELDLKLVVTANADTEHRAKIAAKFLDLAGYDIPVGIGVPMGTAPKSQAAWVEDYDLRSYRGTVHKDGIDAMIDLINNYPEKIKIVCIGPLTNIAEALRRCPPIAQKADIISMLGSINKGTLGAEGKIAEWNVIQDVKAAQEVFAGDWPIDITPLDTCGLVKLNGSHYQKIYNSTAVIPRLIIENYSIWDSVYQFNKIKIESSVLYDTVAVYMAFSREHLVMEQMGIRIADDGFMHRDPTAKMVNCALGWKNQKAFEQLLTERLIA